MLCQMMMKAYHLLTKKGVGYPQGSIATLLIYIYSNNGALPFIKPTDLFHAVHCFPRLHFSSKTSLPLPAIRLEREPEPIILLVYVT